MSRKFAVKRLTATDLTFFRWHLDHYPKGRQKAKQKAINMDARPFVTEMFPSIPEMAAQTSGRFPLDLSIFGPGLAGLHNLQRKILKQQKNWRLNGEVVANPDNMPDRYNPLQEGDFAIFGFEGAVVPVSARMVLVAKAVPDDAKLHASIERHFGSRSMTSIPAADLEAVVYEAAPPDGHPVLDFVGIQKDVLEEVGYGGQAGVARVLTARRGRGMSKSELQEAKKNAEAVGRLGEEIVNIHLDRLLAAGEIERYEWISDTNAVSPFDFHVRAGGIDRVLDAKATSGDFDTPVHISFAELQRMAGGPEPYDLFRLYSVSDSGGKLRVAIDVAAAAKTILSALSTLPKGVRADSFSVDSGLFTFGAEVEIMLDEDED